MMRFFWTILLPLSATGGCAAVLLWLTRPLLQRMGRMHWPVNAVIAVLCLFVIPVFLFVPKVSPEAWPLPIPVPSTAPVQDTPVFGAAAPDRSLVSEGAFPADDASFAAAVDPSTGTNADMGAPAASAAAGAENAAGAAPAGRRDFAAGVRPVILYVLPLFWAAGMVVVLLRSAVSYLRFAARLQWLSHAVTDPAVLAALQAAQKKSGLARMPELRCTKTITSPLAMGILRPCIYLPAGIPADASLVYALQHECIHLRKGHLFWKLAAQLMCTVHWFDPAVWLLAQLLNEACEFDCDRAVAAALNDRERHGYCAALLDAADAGRIPRCVSAFSRPAQILRKRIEAVLAPRAQLRKRVAAVVLCAALVLSVAGLTACAARQAADSAAELLPSPQSDPAPGGILPQETDPEQTDHSTSMPETGTQLLQSGLFWDEPDQAAAEWVWPVPGVKYITTRFRMGGHEGVDICASRDAAILAVKGGTVTFAGYEESHWADGNYVEIDHGDGWKSRYTHCSRLLVQAGEPVLAGQVIACVGSTGASTGYHCHLELLHDDMPVDPFSVFGIRDDDPENDAAYAAFSLNAAPQRTNLTFKWHRSRETAAESKIAEKILGDGASEEERSRFDQNARFWQASFTKPVTVMNEQKGEAYVTLFLCEYEEQLYICDVLQCGFTEGDGWERISDIVVEAVNSNDTQKPSEVTIWANFRNGNETKSTLITSTFVPAAAQGEWGYAPQSGGTSD